MAGVLEKFSLPFAESTDCYVLVTPMQPLSRQNVHLDERDGLYGVHWSDISFKWRRCGEGRAANTVFDAVPKRILLLLFPFSFSFVHFSFSFSSFFFIPSLVVTDQAPGA
jgi:hypothetical protein